MRPPVNDRIFNNKESGPLAPASVARTLEDLVRIAESIGVRWALIGGQALIAYGMKRETLDLDALVERHATQSLAIVLCACAGWTPLAPRSWTRDYVAAKKPTRHHFDDLVLWNLPCERVMYSLWSPGGVLVQLLSAQHPIERAMVEEATPGQHVGVTIPLSSLGGVLVVKGLAGRDKDLAAIGQAAAQLPSAALDEAVAWLQKHHRTSAEWLRSVMERENAQRAL